MKRILATALTFAAISSLAGCAAAPPRHFLSQSGSLMPCPSAPHCVSSEAARDNNHYVPPLAYSVSKARAYKALLAVLQHMKRTRIVTQKPDYIHATVTSAVFGFVDDVTFRFQPQDKRIQMKSASRVGYYDFGVNGRRAAYIRKRFNARLNGGSRSG